MVPSALEMFDLKSGKGLTIWKNPRPGSSRLCRIMRFRYVKETMETIAYEVKLIKEEIKKLKPTTIKFGQSRTRCEVTHKMIMSMVDGKVCQALTETPSSQSCHIWGKIRQVYPPKNFLSPISLKVREIIVLVNLF